ncbi:MAG TPA: hypothetical protein VF815_46800 [Myxococcaceae bacterium]
MARLEVRHRRLHLILGQHAVEALHHIGELSVELVHPVLRVLELTARRGDALRQHVGQLVGCLALARLAQLRHHRGGQVQPQAVLGEMKQRVIELVQVALVRQRLGEGLAELLCRLGAQVVRGGGQRAQCLLGLAIIVLRHAAAQVRGDLLDRRLGALVELGSASGSSLSASASRFRASAAARARSFSGALDGLVLPGLLRLVAARLLR